MERLEIIWRFAEVQPALKQNQRLNLCSFWYHKGIDIKRNSSN